jgi:two-component system, cell cycle sensor histidine kinase and response regulator CckA
MEGSPPLNETVLIVDDEPSVREIAADMLRSEGYIVLEASSGTEALEVCADRRCKIDLLLTDLIMPGMTGRMLADVLTARCAGLSVLFMSGYIDGSRRETMVQGLQFIQKPLDRDRLTSMIRELLKQKSRRP